MQDETVPPIPVKDVPTQPVQAVTITEQPVNPPSEPLKVPPAAKEQKIAVKAEHPSVKHASSTPIIPVMVAVIVFVGLAVCTYFVFKGM